MHVVLFPSHNPGSATDLMKQHRIISLTLNGRVKSRTGEIVLRDVTRFLSERIIQKYSIKRVRNFYCIKLYSLGLVINVLYRGCFQIIIKNSHYIKPIINDIEKIVIELKYVLEIFYGQSQIYIDYLKLSQVVTSLRFNLNVAYKLSYNILMRKTCLFRNTLTYNVAQFRFVHRLHFMEENGLASYQFEVSTNNRNGKPIFYLRLYNNLKCILFIVDIDYIDLIPDAVSGLIHFLID